MCGLLVKGVALCEGDMDGNHDSAQFSILFTCATSCPNWERVVNETVWPLYPRERDLVPVVEEGGWAPGPVWTGAEILPPPSTGIQSSAWADSSDSLYWLRYPGLEVQLMLVHGLRFTVPPSRRSPRRYFSISAFALEKEPLSLRFCMQFQMFRDMGNIAGISQQQTYNCNCRNRTRSPCSNIQGYS
jgi:hypothetical protein